MSQISWSIYENWALEKQLESGAPKNYEKRPVVLYDCLVDVQVSE